MEDESLSSRLHVDGVDFPTVAAAAMLATAAGLMARQTGHVVVGTLAGGHPTLVTSVGFEGYWSGLRNAGALALSASGSVAHASLAVFGWLVVRRGVREPTAVTSVGWIFFAVNAWIPTMYLIATPLVGAGDWMYLLERLPHLGPMRASAAVTGLFIAGQLWRATVESLARVVGNGPSEVRARRARGITRAVWLTGGLVAVAAAVLDPAGPLRAVGVAAAGTFGSTWPILLAARNVPGTPVPGAPLRLERSPAVIVVSAVAALALIALFGPGIVLD